MEDLIQINGRGYRAAIASLKRAHNITDGENAGRTMAPRALMIRDIIGTFISYTLTFETKALDAEEYDALVAALVQPVDSVSFTAAYGQRQITFDAYISKVEDEFLGIFQGVRRWGRLAVTFTPMEPNIPP